MGFVDPKKNQTNIVFDLPPFCKCPVFATFVVVRCCGRKAMLRGQQKEFDPKSTIRFWIASVGEG